MGGKDRDELIRNVAEETARAVCEKFEEILRESGENTPNYYKAMQDLLREYPKLKELAQQEDEYLELRDHDRSISVAPPDTGIARSAIEVRQEREEARRENYARTMTQLGRLEQVIHAVSDRPEFIVIRMYYFGEGADGEIRPRQDKRITFFDIAGELEEAGNPVSEGMLNKWHSKIIREMVRLMWGVKGAVSLQTPRHRKKRENP